MIVKGRNVSTATAALAYRIYGHCHPGWGHTYADVADAMGVYPQRVQRCAVAVGWTGRFTAVSEGGGRYAGILFNGADSTMSSTSDFEPFRRMAAMAVDEE